MAGQLFAVNSLGGYFYSQNLSDELREAQAEPSRKIRIDRPELPIGRHRRPQALARHGVPDADLDE